MERDYTQYYCIVVGAGIYGATLANVLAKKGKRVLVIDRRNHIAGNIYSEFDEETGIEVHKYGSHIFHTKSDEVWEFLNAFTPFNNYVHTVHTRHDGKLYPMPINLETINEFFGTKMNEDEAREFVKNEAEKEGIKEPENFEEQAICLVGRRLYEAFLKNYTAKQWGTEPTRLSADLLKRIPVRFSHNNRYFMDAKHQGIPMVGYTEMVRRMIDRPEIDVELNVDFKAIKEKVKDQLIVYCGQVDELFDYKFGVLPYRSLRFEVEKVENGIGEAVINEADLDVPYTRTHDFKYYQIHNSNVVEQDRSIISREYPDSFEVGKEAYYPINNEETEALYLKYVGEAKKQYPKMLFGGRLGAYRYWDMDVAVEKALQMSKAL